MWVLCYLGTHALCMLTYPWTHIVCSRPLRGSVSDPVSGLDGSSVTGLTAKILGACSSHETGPEEPQVPVGTPVIFWGTTLPFRLTLSSPFFSDALWPQEGTQRHP